MRDDRKKDQNARLIELPSPFPLEPGTQWLIEPAEGFGAAQLDRWREGTLGRPFVFDSDGMRYLLFNTLGTQSSMRLDEPDALVSAYTRKMMAFLLFMPEPRHVLMVGLGGGSLAKFCYRHLPQTRISVVEINADVISALRRRLAKLPDTLRNRATDLEQDLGLEFPVFLERLRAGELLATDHDRSM